MVRESECREWERGSVEREERECREGGDSVKIGGEWKYVKGGGDVLLKEVEILAARVFFVFKI